MPNLGAIARHHLPRTHSTRASDPSTLKRWQWMRGLGGLAHGGLHAGGVHADGILAGGIAFLPHANEITSPFPSSYRTPTQER